MANRCLDCLMFVLFSLLTLRIQEIRGRESVRLPNRQSSQIFQPVKFQPVDRFVGPLRPSIPFPTLQIATVTTTPPKQFLVLGNDADPGDWPWQVFIEVDNGGRECGGVLISNEYVLTAAHCIVGHVATKLTFGAHLRDDTGINVRHRTVETTCCHDDYDDVTLANDICLLKLSSPVSYTNFIQKVTLPSHNSNVPADGTTCVITGFGMDITNQPAQILQEGYIGILNKQKCKNWYAEVNTVIPTHHFCAGYEFGGTDTCAGDSGGPLVCSNNGAYVLHGITSFGGDPCGIAKRPGVYTKVSSYMDWISTKMSQPCEDFHWGSWTTECDVTCGKGVETKRRDCLDEDENVVPSHNCQPGSAVDYGVCYRQECQSFHWSKWQTECSVTCGTGTETKTRECLNQDNQRVPDHYCSPGSAKQTGICHKPDCKSYEWSPWIIECTVTCGQGTEIGTRECLDHDKEPVHSSYCGSGKTEKTGICYEGDCDEYHWGEWKTACSKTCGRGVETRKRNCLNKYNQVVSSSLCQPGKDYEIGSCYEKKCPEHFEEIYHWGKWKETKCSAPCGRGTKTRTRDCLDSANRVQYPSNKCGPGKTYDKVHCYIKDCEEYHWGPWSGTCSRTCGRGTKIRTRECRDRYNRAVFPSTKCHPGTDFDRRPCSEKPCQNVNSYEWAPWQQWTQCRVGISSEDPCNGSQSSYRECRRGYEVVSVTKCGNGYGDSDFRTRPCTPPHCS